MLRRHCAIAPSLGLTVLICVVLAGCGGSSRPAAGAPALTRTAYIAKADGICKSEAAKVHRLEPANVTDADPTRYVHDLVAGARIQRKTLARLRRLPAPVADRTTLAAIWHGEARAIRADARFASGLSALLNQMEPANGDATLSVGSSLDRRTGYMVLAERYGFRYCGRWP